MRRRCPRRSAWLACCDAGAGPTGEVSEHGSATEIELAGTAYQARAVGIERQGDTSSPPFCSGRLRRVCNRSVALLPRFFLWPRPVSRCRCWVAC